MEAIKKDMLMLHIADEMTPVELNVKKRFMWPIQMLG